MRQAPERTLPKQHTTASQTRGRRKLIGTLELTPALAEEYERSGLLEVQFTDHKPIASAHSTDTNRSIVGFAPSGQICWLLVQDYFGGDDTRSIPFDFGTVEIVNDGLQLAIYLWGQLPPRRS